MEKVHKTKVSLYKKTIDVRLIISSSYHEYMSTLAQLLFQITELRLCILSSKAMTFVEI